MSVSYNVKELFSGVLHKCGGKIKSWNRRWFVLKSDYCLYYYKDTAKGHLGVISLRDPKFKVRKGSVSDASWPKGVVMDCTIAVVTTHRTYFMYSSSAQEAEEWIRILDGTRMKLLDEANSANRLLSGSRSYSELATNSKTAEKGSDRSTSLSNKPLSDSALNENEQTYEVVYDLPEADLSHSDSSKSSPNLDSKESHTNSSGTDGDVNSIYDLAKADDTKHQEQVDSNQPLYTEALAPDDVDREQDEPSAVYDDVEIQHPIPAEKQMHDENDKAQEVYESVCIDNDESPLTPSAKNLPLPPVPVARNISSGSGGQPIYEDIPDPNREDGSQPLYEAVMADDSPTHERYVKEADKSDDEGHSSSGPPPPLPPKDDLPPLPPKDNAPQLPPKDSPSTPHKSSQDLPTLPLKGDIRVPPLPPKEEHQANGRKTDVSPLQLKEGNHPPLPSKEDVLDGNHQPSVSPRHSQPTHPSSPSTQHGNINSLSPSAQRKPIPRERTLTPPPSPKPSPTPRRKVSPTATTATETPPTTTRQVVNGHTSSSPPSATTTCVTVQVSPPTTKRIQDALPPSELIQAGVIVLSHFVLS